MSQLRAYHLNGGDMLELVRFQEQKVSKAVGDEYQVISAEEMLRFEKRRHGELGKYMETITHHVSLDTKKKVYFQSHLWGL